MLEEALEVLRTTGWFSHIDPQVQAALQRDAQLVHGTRDETLFHYNDPGAGLFGIVSGAVQLSFPRQDGVLVPFVHLGRGFWLGDLAALSGQPGMVSIENRSDVTAVHVPARAVRDLVKDMPEAYQAFYNLTRLNVSLALRLISGMTANSTDMKIALRLLILEDFSDGEDGWLSLTRADLALSPTGAVLTVEETFGARLTRLHMDQERVLSPRGARTTPYLSRFVVRTAPQAVGSFAGLG